MILGIHGRALNNLATTFIAKDNRSFVYIHIWVWKFAVRVRNSLKASCCKCQTAVRPMTPLPRQGKSQEFRKLLASHATRNVSRCTHCIFIVPYGCQSWSLTPREQHRLRRHEKMKIYEHMKEEADNTGARSEAWILTARTLGPWVRIQLEAWICFQVFMCFAALCCHWLPPPPPPPPHGPRSPTKCLKELSNFLRINSEFKQA
jgi:hypothetical protein